MEPCDGCGKLYPLHRLDAKPSYLAGIRATPEMIANAADRGRSFDRLECRECYGTGWCEAHP